MLLKDKFNNETESNISIPLGIENSANNKGNFQVRNQNLVEREIYVSIVINMRTKRTFLLLIISIVEFEQFPTIPQNPFILFSQVFKWGLLYVSCSMLWCCSAKLHKERSTKAFLFPYTLYHFHIFTFSNHQNLQEWKNLLLCFTFAIFIIFYCWNAFFTTVFICIL